MDTCTNRIEPLDVDAIEEARRGAVIGHKVVVFKSTASTNDIAWEYAGKAANHGLCVLAESQTKGRGRRGRKWHSRPGESILCSVLLLESSLEAETLTLAAAVATAEAMRLCCGIRGKIKWPNDILIRDKKAAGILVEMKTLRKEPRFVVGIGINCNQEAQAFAEHRLNLPATSIKIETSHAVDRTGLVCKLLEQLELWLSRPGDKGIRKWLELSGMLGQRVTVEYDGKKYSGTCRGIDPVQGLILQLDRGPVQFFAASHTSLINDRE